MVVTIVIGKEMKWEWGSKDTIILTLDKTGATTVPNLSALCLSLSTSVAYKKYASTVILTSTEVSFSIIFFGWVLILAYYNKQNQIYM